MTPPARPDAATVEQWAKALAEMRRQWANAKMGTTRDRSDWAEDYAERLLEACALHAQAVARLEHELAEALELIGWRASSRARGPQEGPG
jgi:hypothetical protein